MLDHNFGVYRVYKAPVKTIVPLYLHFTENAKPEFSFQTLI